VTTPGGTTVATPAGVMTSRASTDACGSCGFGDGDGVPWADSTAATTAGSSATFASDHGLGPLSGSLWRMDSGWSPTASVDHDETGGGIVTATAQLVAPALRVLELQGAPAGFDGAVEVDPFTAKSSAISGYTLVAPDVSTGTTTRLVRLWDGSGYRSVIIDPGSAVDTTASASFTIGDHLVSFISRVQSQPSTFSTAGTAPRNDAAAQHPSMLLITVDVTVTSLTLTEPTTTTTTTTTPTTTTSPTTTTEPPPTTTSATTTSEPATTVPATTVPPVALVTDHFTVVFDYGRVSTRDTWLAKAP